jgi:hypothetical protein
MRKSLLFVTAVAFAYLPPVDTVGPLTVRIDGPAEITRTGVALPVGLTLENKSDAPLRGAVRLAVIDKWRVEPAGKVSFTVEGHKSVRLSFTVTAAAGSFNAHYPIHAFAEIEGERQIAHPVLIVETKFANPPRPELAIDWKTVDLPADSGLALWRLPVHRTVIAVFKKAPRTTAAGWQGSDPETHAVAQFGSRVQRGDTRETLAMHPPYHSGAGTILTEFPLRLPPGQKILLTFANAVRDSDPGGQCGDGVTFRVRALPLDAPAGREGEVLYDRHTDAKTWQDAQADLSRFAGQSIRLQLESHPGPKNNTNCDLSYWAEPTLVAGNVIKGSNAARNGCATLGRFSVCPGQRGLLDAAVSLGKVSFQGFRVRVLGDALEDWRSVSTFLSAAKEPANGRYRVRHRFRNPAGTFDLLAELWTERDLLQARFWLENAPPPRPWQVAYLEDVSIGAWSEPAERIYAGDGNVLQRPKAFRLSFDGHRLSTSFAGFEFANGAAVIEGVDVPPTDLEVDPARKLYALHAEHPQTLTFIPTSKIWEGPGIWREVNGLKAAGGVPKLAGRFVFDLWGGKYADSAQNLERAFRYGLTDAIVIWHNWQRWGYDYRLPEIYPPNPQAGTFEEFLALVKTAKDHGVLFAPHDNYIDYYPDAEGYTYDRIAFNPAGAPVKAWWNEGRQAQSYRWRPDVIKPFVEHNLGLIKSGFAPTGYFIDVWSSAGPYDYWTRDGRFYDKLSTLKIWRDTFAWIRETLGGNAPQISESGHDQLIGWLDGGQTNHLRVGKPAPGRWGGMVWNIECEDAERIPWFDAAHHDRFALHGAGYESRYTSGLDTKLHGMYSDDYIATEVLDGHPAMASRPFGPDVVRKYWLLHDLMRALALRRIASVEFNGGNLHRQHVRWDNGVDIWVNRGEGDWTVAGHTLPQYGFYAQGADVAAAIERRDGATVEWSRSPAATYVNARGGKPMDFDGVLTSGAVRIVRDQITPLPGGSAFELRLRRTSAPHEVEALDEQRAVMRAARFRFDSGAFTLTCDPDVFAYRLR